MRISAKSSISVCVALMAFNTPVFGDESDEENLRCIWLDASASELNLDPADQMQRWCDLTPDQSEIACFDFSVGGEWGKTSSFAAKFVRLNAVGGSYATVFIPNDTIAYLRQRQPRGGDC